MNLQEALCIERGITSVIGSGGKSTLLARLAAELPGTVVLTTTTHFLPFGGVPTATGADGDELRALLERHRVVCVGRRAQSAAPKLAAGAMAPAELARLADYVLVEADGSRRLPLKAHADWEPVIPAGSAQSVLVVGASGFGRPVAEAVHRPDVFCKLAGCVPADAATPERVAAVIRVEGLASRVLVNQCEGEESLACARRLAALLDVPACAGSVRDGRLQAL